MTDQRIVMKFMPSIMEMIKRLPEDLQDIIIAFDPQRRNVLDKLSLQISAFVPYRISKKDLFRHIKFTDPDDLTRIYQKNRLMNAFFQIGKCFKCYKHKDGKTILRQNPIGFWNEDDGSINWDEAVLYCDSCENVVINMSDKEYACHYKKMNAYAMGTLISIHG